MPFRKPPILFRTRRAARRLPDAEGGKVAIEFALLAPLMFAILFGVVVFGVQYATRIALTYAAAEGGRAAVGALQETERESDATTAINRALGSISPLVDPDAVTVGYETTSSADGERFTIKLTYTDTRFARLPFVPHIDSSSPIAVSYFITDPSS
jgi:Flp pilus assembly protein TadG